MRFNRLVVSLLTTCAVSYSVTAMAQDSSVIISRPLELDYDRGRNETVLERYRPEYAQIGVRSGGMTVYPQIQAGIGYTDNVYRSETNEQSDGFVSVNPSIRAQSNWSRHELQISAGGRFDRYFDASARNESGYYVRGLGRVDASETLSFVAEGQVGKTYESPFSSGTDAALVGISNYDYNQQGVRAIATFSRNKFTLGYSRSEYDFNPIELGNNTFISQADRDRVVHSVAGQVENALSPDTALFAQLSYARTNYERSLLNGLENRDSDGYRALVGVNMDLSALLRGAIGVGYTWRQYDSPVYGNVDGFSAEAKLEYFMSQLTTLTFGARRLLEDSNFDAIGAYFDNRVSFRVDHELLYNLLLDGSVSYARQNYIGSTRRNDIAQGSAGARYLISPRWEAGLRGQYSYRDRSGLNYDGKLNEFRVATSLTFKY